MIYRSKEGKMKKDILQKQKEKIESPERLEKIQCKRLLRSKREA
jgi:hypothetical protein